MKIRSFTTALDCLPDRITPSGYSMTVPTTVPTTASGNRGIEEEGWNGRE
jgi:hypothetical protein